MPNLMNCSHYPDKRCKECEEKFPAPKEEFTRDDAENWLITKGIIKKDMKKIPEKGQEGLRMYFFVMYNLSGIQKGIQAGHAALEYARAIEQNKFSAKYKREYHRFVDDHKTFILLCGGGSQDMIDREKELDMFGIPFVSFKEPDLNNSISAIAFIVPEEVYGFDEDDYLKRVSVNIQSWEEEEKYRCYQWLKSFRLASN